MGLDVTEPEPLPKDHALWKAKNIIITPHMSAQSDLGQSVRALIYREQVRRFVTGDKLLSVVDFKKEIVSSDWRETASRAASIRPRASP